MLHALQRPSFDIFTAEKDKVITGFNIKMWNKVQSHTLYLLLYTLAILDHLSSKTTLM